MSHEGKSVWAAAWNCNKTHGMKLQQFFGMDFAYKHTITNWNYNKFKKEDEENYKFMSA